MNNKDISQNNFNKIIYETSDFKNLQQIENTYVPVTHCKNVTTSDQQPVSNVILNDTISPNYNHQQYDVSNNIPHHNYCQSMPNNTTPSQFYPRYINQNPPNPPNPPQFNIFPPLNSFNITINSPQTNIIVIPVTNPDINIKFETFYNNNSQT